MKLDSKDLQALSSLARQTAYEAGKLIAEKRAGVVPVSLKEGQASLAAQVVTEVDLLAQELILKRLTQSCQQFDLAVLGEESADDGERLEKDYFWCIDPIDGTLLFTQSKPGYAVSIGLVARDGTPQIGVIYDVARDVLYESIRGQGALRNGKPWKSGPIKPMAETTLTLVYDQSFDVQNDQTGILEAVRRLAVARGYGGFDTLLFGGAALNACAVFEQAPAVYLKFPKDQKGGGSLWDFAAGACIASEAGAAVSDIHGQPLDLNRPDSTYMNHRGALFASDPDLSAAVQEMYRSL